MISSKSKLLLTVGLTNLRQNYSNMVKAKKFVYVNQFLGEPKLTDFVLEDEELPALKNGGTHKPTTSSRMRVRL